jgi:hypothetical protein
MNRKKLLAYEESERAYARSTGKHCVKAGIIQNLKPAFHDLKLPWSYGVQRRQAPLHALIFLYPSTLVFVPPTTEASLTERLGMDMKAFLQLCDHGLITPMIGHPQQYADRAHLDPILQRKPASIWARGDEVAHAYANAKEYWKEARRILPLNKIHNLKWVRAKWCRQYGYLDGKVLSDQIDIEICTNYVNLCIFGFERFARTITETQQPSLIAKRLIEANEVATYPQLLGVGGSINYGLSDAPLIQNVRKQFLLDVDTTYVSETPSILLNGLGVSFPSQINAETIKRFHADGMPRHLQKAWSGFEQAIRAKGKDAAGVFKASSQVEETLHDALRLIRSNTYNLRRTKLAKISDNIVKTSSIAGIAGAALAANLNPIAALLAGFSITGFVAKNTRAEKMAVDAIVDFCLSMKQPGYAAHLWWIDKWKSGNESKDA